MRIWTIEFLRRQKVWLGVGCLIGSLLFISGYRYVVGLNQTLPERIPQRVITNKPVYQPNDSLLELRLERDREQGREIEQVQQMLDKVGLTDEIRKEAEQELWRLNQAVFKEHELENLLQAKGYKETLVTITPKLVTVMVTGKLIPRHAEMIGTLTAEVTGFNLEQIQIVQD